MKWINLEQLAENKSLIAIRKAYINLLPFIIVSSLVIFLIELLSSCCSNYSLISLVDTLSKLYSILTLMFPNLIIAAISWELDKHKPQRAICLMSITLISFWILTDWSGWYTGEGTIGVNNLFSLWIFPSLVLARVIFRTLNTSRLLPTFKFLNIGPTLKKNLNYILPSIVTILIIYGLTLVFPLLLQVIPFDEWFVARFKSLPYMLQMIIYILILQGCWFFGIHGYNTTLGLLEVLRHESSVTTALMSPDFVFLYSFPGGAGATLSLLIVILLAGKNNRFFNLGLVALPLTIFNVNEVLLYGIPLILNPRFMIPFILVPVINTIISYLVIAAGWVDPHIVDLHWSVPIILNVFIATGNQFDIAAISLQLTCIITGALVYYYFWNVNSYNSQQSQIFSKLHTLLAGKELDVTVKLEAANDSWQRRLTQQSIQQWGLFKQQGDILNKLGDGRFIFYYQPQVSAKTKEIIGCEALLRFQKTNGEIVPPYFLNVIEKYEFMMHELDYWVISESICQVEKWQERGVVVPISINLSPYFFDNTENQKHLLEGLDGLAKGSLAIEITEHSIVNNLEKAQQVLKTLRNANIKVSLDDFGVGYSSFGYIDQFEIDVLKLDKVLIDRIVRPRSYKIILALTMLAYDLGLKTVAEGVETKEQLELLQNAGIDYIQGYYCSKPLSVDEFENYYFSRNGGSRK